MLVLLSKDAKEITATETKMVRFWMQELKERNKTNQKEEMESASPESSRKESNQDAVPKPKSKQTALSEKSIPLKMAKQTRINCSEICQEITQTNRGSKRKINKENKGSSP